MNRACKNIYIDNYRYNENETMTDLQKGQANVLASENITSIE